MRTSVKMVQEEKKQPALPSWPFSKRDVDFRQVKVLIF
ncbi:hypothetical protein CHCC20488_0689 [Bacillus paralicheniformis]|uniref:Uncharacterized protein n=1 Tax=Bacillus paralicheniformis TaxID=1648923 RepID=A0A6N2EZ78_9BACI|nr:hypothetical protein SC10_B2orf03521 [Bacillus paralicheniformis]OLF90022.1 hypothetical protein B4121_3297 [Bacillus paralicheniformis]OLG07713.1 hypothetical protein B4125_1894 [Bacillus paralicheniformis]TWJ37410.1 hypothetical protein CHCC5027_0908 [Bacillus paralicheniformis]TWJ60685.1 hypothetical protein CHCC5023_0802 [Bacillus paralicheniformis]